MKVDLFDFHLPPDRIALYPADPRDSSRMLVVNPNGQSVLKDAYARDLPDFLRAGDLLVMNDTKVIPAYLHGTIGDAKIEINLHQRVQENMWWAFMKNARRASVGKIVELGQGVRATVREKKEGGEVLLAFDVPEGETLTGMLMRIGTMPLPPYIASKRTVGENDAETYQTVYAVREGAVAAPTAGLHFTTPLLQLLTARGVNLIHVTLHVGAGTFLPVKADDTDAHVMHAEWGEITADVAAKINATREAGGRIVAVGTTSLRLLESAADPVTGDVRAFSNETDIFIIPGYRFKVADMVMTNFHLPRSTLFMLVSAFAGLETMKGAYAHAIKNGYRFYSYGDASLLFRVP